MKNWAKGFLASALIGFTSSLSAAPVPVPRERGLEISTVDEHHEPVPGVMVKITVTNKATGEVKTASGISDANGKITMSSGFSPQKDLTVEVKTIKDATNTQSFQIPGNSVDPTQIVASVIVTTTNPGDDWEGSVGALSAPPIGAVSPQTVPVSAPVISPTPF